jgi:hypothetical protein
MEGHPNTRALPQRGIQERVWFGVAVGLLAAACVDEHEVQVGAESYLLGVSGDAECFARLNGTFPSSISELRGSPCWKRTGEPIDPWGRPYHLEVLKAGRPECRVFSLGKDGLPGGSGLDEDFEFFAR